ncbi:MAG: isoprenylcysteine carboxylmethyltransferase family protein [Erysipelotrichaceae bacterium]|nr:isoprenylcysteine carboxylmethyltransferase family protein [Erysipelotrichaceae bacterium]
MKKGLLKEALIKYCAGIILVALLLFLPAGTLKWRNGWLFMALLFIPMCVAGILMYVKAPDLLRSRLNAKEKQSEQKDVISYSGIMFVAAFVAAGLNHRYGWITMPDVFVVIGAVVFLLSYAGFGEVLRENAFLSRTIEVKEDQTVVDTGLYGIVRHPMYTASVFLFLSMPLILNSLISFLIMLVYIPLIVKRIRNEEEVLEKELKGYREYKEKIRYRLIPYIW